MPIETPTSTVSAMAVRASWIVAGTRSTTTRSAGDRYWKDWPKSPRTTLRRKIPYCTQIGSRRPRGRFSSSTADCGAPSGRSILAGSPGTTRRMTKTRIETPTSVTADCQIRVSRYERITARGALGDSDLVEEHVIVAPRLEVAQLVADRVDRDAVVRPDLRLLLPEDLLDLLVLLLAHFGIGHAALGDQLLDARIGKARELLRARLGEPLAEVPVGVVRHVRPAREERSEEHTSELQSRLHLVCRLLLEK